PYRAHRDANLTRIQVADSQFSGDILEFAVAEVAIERALAALAAVGQINVLPAVAVEIHDRYGRAHRSDLRHDVIQLRIQFRRGVSEIDARASCCFLKAQAVTGDRRRSVRGHGFLDCGETFDDERRGKQSDE